LDARVLSPAAAAPDHATHPVDSGLVLTHGYGRLSQVFYTRVAPTPLPDPYLVAKSDDSAARLGLAPARFDDPGFIAALTGSQPLAGSDPLATVYRPPVRRLRAPARDGAHCCWVISPTGNTGKCS
jgi:hypothetical protein